MSILPYRLKTGHIINHLPGDIVYVKTDVGQDQRMVTGITLRPGGQTMYILSLDGQESLHFDIEIDIMPDLEKLRDLGLGDDGE